MYRSSLVSGLIALFMFGYAQTRGVDPLSIFSGSSQQATSRSALGAPGYRGSFHK